jgi:hypothetical protein
MEDEGIKELVVTLQGSIDDLYAEVQAIDNSEPDITDADSEEELVDMIGYSDLVDSVEVVRANITAIESDLELLDIDREDEEVETLHESLTDALNNYKEMLEVLVETAVAMEDIYIEVSNISDGILDATIVITSKAQEASLSFAMFLMSAQDKYLSDITYLSSPEFTQMVVDGEVDQAQMMSLAANMSAAVEELEVLETGNEAEELIKVTLLEIVQSGSTLFELLISSSGTLEKTADYDSIAAYVDSYKEPNNLALNDWIESIE